MANNIEFEVEKVYKGRTNEIFVITDPETQVQYIRFPINPSTSCSPIINHAFWRIDRKLMIIG